MSDTPLLQLSAVSKHFGGVLAVDSVDLTVHAGTVHALLGENGAGKSTLIKMIAGVHEPDSGAISVGGRQVRVRDTATVSSDNVAGGRQAADALAVAVGEKGKILQLRGEPGTSASRERGKGFTDGLSKHDGIDVAAKQPVEVKTVTKDNVEKFSE